MLNIRKYGRKPYKTAVIHGGPGAQGELAPVARELSSLNGILEPLQTGISVKEQLRELKTAIEKYGDWPVTLIGFSWGAWLSFMAAAKYPRLVKKLLLVGSGPFESKYAGKITAARLRRLSTGEQAEFRAITQMLDNAGVKNNRQALERLGELCSKTDSYSPIKQKPEKIDCKTQIFKKVWREASELRRSGKLLRLGADISCPVIAIHGDYDPHPAQGVRKPLSGVIRNFRFITLRRCGHKPWIERKAKDEFYRIVKKEISPNSSVE